MLLNLKIFAASFIMLFITNIASATTSASNYMNTNTYNNLYPYMNNTMRTKLNPGTTPSNSNAQINVLTRTKSTNNNSSTSARSVVPRTTYSARIITNSTNNNNSATSSRSATASSARTAMPTTSTNRKVVARSGTSTNTQNASARSNRGDASTLANRNATGVIKYESTESIPSSRCMADYIECMNGYCERENTKYNRCYCSTKLAQIDAKYQTEIDQLIKEILILKSTNNWTQEEMDEYWMEMIGKYTGENSWENLESALNIDWSSTESRVRGQQAFVTGHTYCVQHLKGCAYMANNLRDAYRSEIARDCTSYETSLQKVKSVAESLVESYK